MCSPPLACSPLPAPGVAQGGPAVRRSAGYAFVSGYVILLLLFGVLPTGYAIYLSLTEGRRQVRRAFELLRHRQGLSVHPGLEHIAAYLVIWLVVRSCSSWPGPAAPRRRLAGRGPCSVSCSTSRAPWPARPVSRLALHARPRHSAPGTLCSPIFNYSELAQTIEPAHLPPVFAIIAFWTGAGRLDRRHERCAQQHLRRSGRLGPDGRRQRLADGGTRQAPADQEVGRLHGDPGLRRRDAAFCRTPIGGRRRAWGWSARRGHPNQLAYYMAFQNDNFNYAASISVDLLGARPAVPRRVLVFRSSLFEID